MPEPLTHNEPLLSIMKSNTWTLVLAGAGLIGLPAGLVAEEKPTALLTGLSSTTLSGYVEVSGQWNFGTGNENTPAYSFAAPTKPTASI